MSFSSFANGFCVYPPCEHFWSLAIVMGITLVGCLVGLVIGFKNKGDRK